MPARPRQRRPRPRDAEATRRVLLDAATAVFAEGGFAGARIDVIAARAGVNKRMIYAYFGDKEGLYREVLSSRLRAPASSPAAADHPRRALEALVRWFFGLLREDRAFARLLAWDLLAGGARDREILLDSAAPALDLVADLLGRRGAPASAPRPELFRAAVVALCVGYWLQHPAMDAARRRGRATPADDAFLDYACRLLLG